ncbi:sugar phosphate nucleotidyltransferase [Paenibacillus sp. GCM10023248]|uniref:sugar phosphate nucleotidyltransferase n=1 Tax=Bacillales TaxID=1385 RepID=UPI0023790A89|nr:MULTISPECIES: sugar phosphate nucleotidyltransferase [Bacillales]MDD9269944.1 sugar phosphate nucleotidyltransferase [Paenibacillus sp. MAHUQ-63]MDR6883164.1 NDP-sugar pyrophosphorylase family protein [Bacillus sp. 3255]
MEVVIMTGGKGMRMAPYTKVLPKGLLPVGEQPILEIIVKQLRHYGFTSITMACGYLSSLIQTYFGDGSSRGVDITYHVEREPLGTIGPLKCLRRMSGPFLLINCDVLTTLNFAKFRDFHIEGGSLLTIASQKKGIPIQLGVLETKDDYVTNIIEKPTHLACVSMGIYMMNPIITDYIPANKFFDIPDLIHAVLADDQKVRHYENTDFWLDIGRPSDYTLANEEFGKLKSILLPGES